MRFRLLASALLLVASCHAEARKKPMSDGCTRTVGPAEAGKLAEVIEGLPEGAVLCLEPGTYTGNFVVQRSLTIRGKGAPGEVILDGDGAGTVITVDDVASLKLERLTVTGGAAVQRAGGIYSGAKELLVREVVLKGNRADGEAPGAAIGVYRGQATIERSRIVDNRGRAGAAMYVANAVVTVRDSLVAGNTGTKSTIWVHQLGKIVLEHATVAGNTADAEIELLATMVQQPQAEIRDSIVAGKTAIANGPRLPGKATAARSLIEGEQRGVSDGGGNKVGAPGFEGSGAEPYRPKKDSPARGLAQAGKGSDLAGGPSGTTAGALQ